LASSHTHNITTAPQPTGNKGDTAGDFQVARTAIVSSAHAIHDTYAGFFAPLLPFLIERLSLLKVEAGVFLLLYQGASILQPLIGHLADRSNLRKFALLMPAVSGITLSLLGTAPTYFIAIMYSLVAGISSASLHAILPALVGTLSGRQLGKGLSFWMVAGEIGFMLGPLLVIFMITTFSIETIPWLMIPGILISILLSFLLKDVPHHNSGNHQNAKAPVKEMTLIMLPLAGIVLMRVLLRTASEIYLPTFMMEKGASIWMAGISLTILQGFGVAGTIAGGFLKDKYGFRTVMLLSIILASLGMLAFVGANGILMIASLALMGAASMMVLPVGMSFIQEQFPENRSLANGYYLAMLFGINAVGGVVTGFLYDQIGGYQTYLWSAPIGLLGIPFVFLLPREKATG
jgi:FSR family fosmidomycin resistance protein-like MFS transporter